MTITKNPQGSNPDAPVVSAGQRGLCTIASTFSSNGGQRMKAKSVMALFLLMVWSPTHARTWERHEHSTWIVSTDHGITCSTVRAAVAMWGLNQARQFALERGMTPSQEHRARRCLGSN